MFKKIKSRFACVALILTMLVSFCGTTQAFAADITTFFSGWSMVTSTTNVTKEDGSTGTVFIGEGVTFLENNGNNTAWIQYSGPSGPINAIISTSCLISYSSCYPGTSAGNVKTATTTYYGIAPTLPAGSVSVGEKVAILGQLNGWYYIEYNISGGLRKRGFVPQDTIANASFLTPASLSKDSSKTSSAYINVYGGPSSRYEEIGTIYPNDVVYTYIKFIGGIDNGIVRTTNPINNQPMILVSYPAGGGEKFGWIYESSLQ